LNYQDYLEVSAAQDIDTFERRLVAFAQELGFGIISGSLVVEQGLKSHFINFGNTPQGFVEAHKNLDSSLRDPVLMRLKRLSIPFAYDQAMYAEAGAGDLWDLQAPFGYHAGIAMALHLPEGRHFLLGVDSDRPLPKDDSALTRVMADLQLLAAHAQGAALKLLLPQVPEDEDRPKLTPREAEILKWSMQGKSTWDIARILGLSEHTVNFHVRNASAKLQTSSRTQTVARAIALGLI